MDKTTTKSFLVSFRDKTIYFLHLLSVHLPHSFKPLFLCNISICLLSLDSVLIRVNNCIKSFIFCTDMFNLTYWIVHSMTIKTLTMEYFYFLLFWTLSIINNQPITVLHLISTLQEETRKDKVRSFKTDKYIKRVWYTFRNNSHPLASC